jgi:ABC-type antimicrobial peptide transport system permease subunit
VQLSGFTTLAAQVDRSVVSQRVVAQLSTFFGLLALLLTSIGLYGLMSYAVTRRTNEIGIRVALGARRSGVLWLVMRENLTLVGVGIIAGVPVALVGNRVVASLLFGLGTTDATTLAGASVVLLLVSALAAYVPARKALEVDPMVALRRE